MITLIKPILFAFLTSTAVKKLVIDLLSAYAKSTDNTLDDAAVELVKKNLLLNNLFRTFISSETHVA